MGISREGEWERSGPLETGRTTIYRGDPLKSQSVMVLVQSNLTYLYDTGYPEDPTRNREGVGVGVGRDHPEYQRALQGHRRLPTLPQVPSGSTLGGVVWMSTSSVDGRFGPLLGSPPRLTDRVQSQIGTRLVTSVPVDTRLVYPKSGRGLNPPPQGHRRGRESLTSTPGPPGSRWVWDGRSDPRAGVERETPGLSGSPTVLD